MGTFPDYFLRLGEINRKGPAVLGVDPQLTPLDAADVAGLLADGAQLVDARPAAEFAAGHIPGALSITFRPVFATWLGWLADPRRSLVVVRGADQDPGDIASAAAKVGFDTVAGELRGGMTAWPGRVESSAVGLVDADEVAGGGPVTVLDIRQSAEYAAGHMPGARHIELGGLAQHLVDVPAGPIVVMCGHGERAMGAASILAQSGRTGIRVLAGCPDDYARATGQQLQTES